jgi:hypothetical protein
VAGIFDTGIFDTGIFDHAVVITGTLAATEAQDGFAGTGAVGHSITGTLAATETQDALAASGSITRVITGTLAATEAQDVMIAAGGPGIGIFDTGIFDTGIFDHRPGTPVTGSMSASDAQDTFAGAGTTARGITGSMAATEAQDTMVASGTVPMPYTPILADVGDERKRKKRKDRNFAEYKQEQERLRKVIEEAISPSVIKGQVAVVEQGADGVEIVPVSGQAISIPVPPMFDAAEVSRMVATAVARANAAVEVIRVQRRQEAERSLAQARAELARIIKRRREEEILLLLD